jgi:hypothetical protein
VLPQNPEQGSLGDVTTKEEIRSRQIDLTKKCPVRVEASKSKKKADEEIRTLDPLLGKEMLYH